MFLRLFRSGTQFQIVIFSICVLLLWADGLFTAQAAFAEEMPSHLYSLIFGWTAAFPVMGNILALLMLVLEALILNGILVISGVTARNSYLPALLFMLFFSYQPEMLCMHPAIPGNLLVILSLRMIIKSLHREEAYQEVFTSALFFSSAVLFNIYYLLWLPLIWISLLVNRSVDWREWFIATLGALTPAVYATVVFFWNDQLDEVVSAYMGFFGNLRFLPAMHHFHWMTWTLLALITVTGVPAALFFISGISEKLISIRRVSQIITWMFFLSVVAIFGAKANPFVAASFVLLPLTVFVACWFQASGRLWIRESLFWLLVAGILAAKFLI